MEKSVSFSLSHKFFAPQEALRRPGMQAHNQDLKIVRQNEKMVCFSPKGVGFGERAVPSSTI